MQADTKESENGTVNERDIPGNDDIPVSALNDVVLDLPKEYQDEVFALELLNVIGSYHTCLSQLKAYRHQGDSSGIDKATKLSATLRSQAAWIQHEHPNTIELYKELAAIKARGIKAARSDS